MVDPVVEAAVSSLGKRGPAKSGPPLGNAKKMAKAQRFLAARGIDPAQLASSFGSTGGSSSLTSQPVMSMDELKASIGKLVASMPKDPVKNDSSWAKGLGLVGKALNVIDIPRSYVASKVSTLATGLEEGDPTKVLGALPVIGEAVNVVDNFGGDPNAPKGLLNKVLFADQQQSKDFYNHTGTGEYLQRGINKHGWQGTPLDNAWVKRLIGLAGDIGLDPLTYATLGAGAAVEAPAKAAATVGAKAAVEATAEQGAKQLVKAGAEQVAKEAGTASSKVLGQVAEQVGKTVAKDAGERAAKQAVVEVGEIAADIGTRKSRVLRGWKEISDHIFEQARALGKDDPMRAQLENMGAKIRKARSTWVASNAELADAGVKRGVWLVGSRNPLGQESRVLEGVLRAKEMVGGGLRKAVSDPAAKLLEGTFGEERQNMLRKMARSGIGEAAQIGVSALAFNKDARHTANGMMLDLARGFGKALDMADKAGIDGATLTRAVQDPTVFEELAARTPKAAEAILAVRDEFAKARNMYEAVTKVALPDNPLYMPRRMTSDAWDLINSKPEFKAEMSGPAAFTQARTLRSGQDNAAREVEKQSTVFLGAEVPRNLSDAQVTDWANARYKQIFGDQAPQLFETDPRKLIDSYLSEFKRQMQQDMFTVRWLDAGFGSEQAQKAWNIVGGGKERVTAVADQFMGKVSDMSQQMDSLMADLNRGLGDLKFAKGFEGGAKAFDETVRSTRQLEEALAKGDWQFVREQAQREADRAFLRARRAEGKLAETWQRFGERMSSLRDAAEANIRNVATNRQSALDRLDSKVADIGVARRDAQRAGNDALASLTEARDAAYGRSVQAWDQPRGVANEAAIAAASDAARRKAERDWMPTLADRKALEKLRRTRGSNLTQATLEDIVYGDARRVAGDNAAAKVEAKLRERAVAAEKQRIYKSEFGYAQAEKRLADAEAKGVAQDAAFQQRIADTLATRPQIEDQFARRAANAQAAFNRLPQSQQEEWFRFLNGNKQAASLYKTMQDNYMIGGLLSGEARSGAGIGPYIENLKQDLQRMTVSLTDSSGRVVNSTSSEMRKAARETIDQLDKIASAAKNTLADELYAQAGVVEAEGNFFLSYAFNKTATKELPNDARIARSGDKVLRNRATTEARREVAKAQAGVRKLLQMDAEEQILPMLQNVIARSALSEGFKSLPAEAQALFKQAEENLLKKGNLKNALHLYDKLNNVLKGWLIAKPGFVFRNLIGGLFMNMVAGVSVDSHFRMLRAFEADILRQQGKPGKWERLNKFDRAIYEQVRKFQTQGDTLVGSMTADSPSKSILSWFNPASANFFWLKGNRKFNEVAEDIVLRGSMAFDTLSRDPALIAAFKNGDQAGIDRALQAARSRAIGRVDMFHFSYDKADKSVFENEVMGRLVPFYTYTKNVIPLMTSMMIERPKYFAWANSVARNLQLGVPEDAVLPEYIKESGAIRTPFTAGGNRVYWMQDLPFNQLIDVNNDHVNFAASAFTPLVKTPVELVHGQQFYKKIPLTSDMKPSQYQNVPGLSQALSALGVQRTGNDGQTQFMQDRWQYLLGQLVPPAYQLGNYTAATDTQKLKLPTRATSDLTGIRLRVNTPEDQANEMARQKIKEREKKSQKTRNAKRGYGDFPAGYKPKKNENQK